VNSAQRTNKRFEKRTGGGKAPKPSRRVESPHEGGDKRLSVAADARDLNPLDFPASVRLEGVFRRRGIKRLGQLDGVALNDLRRMGNCGHRTVAELVELLRRVAAGEFSVPAEPLAPASLAAALRRLDEGISRLAGREREIFMLRMGAGKKNRMWTLEEAGQKFGLTRERVRQIMELILPALRKAGGPGLAVQMREIAAVCEKAVCPLTSELFSQWLAGAGKSRRFPIPVYVRLLGELHPGIPAWPEGQEFRTDPRPGQQETAMKVLRGILQRGAVRMPLAEAFGLTAADRRLPGLTVMEFLAALKYARSIAVDFPRPDQPEARLRWLSSGTAANAVLQASDRVLTLNEISARIAKEFGPEAKTWSNASLRRTLTKDFFWLGPSSFGLRQHITLSSAQRVRACEDAYQFLKGASRPISTARILRLGRFAWASKTNPYELAEVLREDRRLAEGRRLVFSVARKPRG
jgi:hypothetical protein